MAISKKKLLASILILTLIGSIGASTYYLASQKNSSLIGTAYMNAPLVGATITIYDLAGNKLYEALNATLSSGVYIQNVVWTWLWSVPTEFKITATGGTVNGEPFTGTLVRYVENYNQNDYYAINIITTLVAAYKDTNSSASYSQAEAAVQAFLEIPSEAQATTIINTLTHSNTFFDSTTFIKQANENGGFDTFVDALTVQIGQGQTHPFKARQGFGWVDPGTPEFLDKFLNNIVNGITDGSYLKSIAGSIASGALGLIGKELMGWTMGLLGFKSAEEQTKEQLEQIQTTMTEMSTKIDQMDAKLNYITSYLSQISSQIAELRSALNTMEINIKQVIGGTSAYDSLTKIDSSYALLANYAKCQRGEISDQTITDWFTAVLSPTTGIPYAVDNLDKRINGNVLGNEKGLLELMVDSMIDQLYKQDPTGATLYGATYRAKVFNLYKGFEAYFEKLLYYETRGLTLIAEGYNARNEIRNESISFANYLTDTWQPMLQKQISLFVAQTERFVINAEIPAQMEFPNMSPILPADNAKVQQHWQATFGKNAPNVAEILPLADHLADILLNGTGRFIARILVLRDTITNVTDPKPTFMNLQTNQAINPIKTQYKTFYVGPDSLPFILFTYDFGKLPLGQYKLMSPTALGTVAPYIGWWEKGIDERDEWWSFKEGLKISMGQLPSVTKITVTNDTDGNPYGYWGGIWYVTPPESNIIQLKTVSGTVSWSSSDTLEISTSTGRMTFSFIPGYTIKVNGVTQSTSYWIVSDVPVKVNVEYDALTNYAYTIDFIV